MPLLTFGEHAPARSEASSEAGLSLADAAVGKKGWTPLGHPEAGRSAVHPGWNALESGERVGKKGPKSLAPGLAGQGPGGWTGAGKGGPEAASKGGGAKVGGGGAAEAGAEGGKAGVGGGGGGLGAPDFSRIRGLLGSRKEG